MDGFVVGLAIFVTVGQLSKLFGVEKTEGNTIEKLVGLLARRGDGGAASLRCFARRRNDRCPEGRRPCRASGSGRHCTNACRRTLLEGRG